MAGYYASDHSRTGNAVTRANQAPAVLREEGIALGGTRDKRIGDDDRQRVTEHLHERFISGHLPEPVYNARAEAAQAARTEHDLEILTSDLPDILPPPEKTGRFRRFLMDNHVAVRTAGYIFGIMGCIGFTIISISISSLLRGALAIAVGTPFAIAGIAGAISCMSALCIWVNNIEDDVRFAKIRRSNQ